MSTCSPWLVYPHSRLCFAVLFLTWLFFFSLVVYFFYTGFYICCSLIYSKMNFQKHISVVIIQMIARYHCYYSDMNNFLVYYLFFSFRVVLYHVSFFQKLNNIIKLFSKFFVSLSFLPLNAPNFFSFFCNKVHQIWNDKLVFSLRILFCYKFYNLTITSVITFVIIITLWIIIFKFHKSPCCIL